MFHHHVVIHIKWNVRIGNCILLGFSLSNYVADYIFSMVVKGCFMSWSSGLWHCVMMWRWRQHSPVEYFCPSTSLHGIMTQIKTWIFFTVHIWSITLKGCVRSFEYCPKRQHPFCLKWYQLHTVFLTTLQQSPYSQPFWIVQVLLMMYLMASKTIVQNTKGFPWATWETSFNVLNFFCFLTSHPCFFLHCA